MRENSVAKNGLKKSTPRKMESFALDTSQGNSLEKCVASENERQ